MTTALPLPERNDRRRSLLLALAFQAAFVALCVYPFLAGSLAEDDPYETVVEFDFRQNAAAASADTRARNATLRPVAERKAAPLTPAPPTLPDEPSPPVLAAPSPLPPVPDVPAPETPEPALAETAPPASTIGEDGTASTEGEVDGAGESSVGSVFGGDGVITRAVVFRPALDDVIVENGTVVLDVCINQRGRVTKVRYNAERSTIHDLDVVRNAQAKAKDYRFEVDRTAPRLECGRLTIKIRGL